MTESDRILVIADRDGTAALVRKRYPGASVTTADTYLRAVYLLGRERIGTVIGYVDPAFARLDDAVAGLRQAGGEAVKLILCCRPETESLARRAMGVGADTYLLMPLSASELDRAMSSDLSESAPAESCSAPTETSPLSDVPAASMPELHALGEVLAHLDGGPPAVLERLATVVRLAIDADGVSVSLDPVGSGAAGLTGCSGQAVSPAVLVEAIPGGDRDLGHITVGARSGGPYSVGDAQKLRHYAILAGHILEVAQRQKQWQEWALTDELSNLPNRRHLKRFLDDVLERAHKERFRVTLLLFDIDNFKAFNDTCGHNAGDEIIRCVAELFKRHCRETDLVTRYGGDEFAVVFWDAEQPRVPGSKHPADALAVLKRVKRAMSDANLPAVDRVPGCRLTISGGLASYPWDASTPEALIARADDALMQAKEAGKNRIYLIDSPGCGTDGDHTSAVDSGV